MPKKPQKNSTVSKVHTFYLPNGCIAGVSIERAASYFGVSERRVRQMLADGALHGEKHGRAWRVTYPYAVRLGTRGPASNAFKNRSAVPKKRWNSTKFNNLVVKKGD